MYKFRYQLKRLRNMGQEWLRLVKLYTTPQNYGHKWHLVFVWDMNGTVWDPSRGLMGREYRIAMQSDPTYPEWGMPMQDDQGNDVHIKRDIFDQVMDTIWDVFWVFWHSIFTEETCNHPHEHCSIEWDGDEETGYYSQHRCWRCTGHLGDESEIDRYLPLEDRRPKEIKGNPINPMDRPTRRRLHDDDEDMFFADDYIS